MAKRFLIGASASLFLLLILWGSYTFFFAPQESKTHSKEDPPKEEVIHEKEESKSIQVLIDAPVISPFISSNTSGDFILYIDKNTGSIQRLNLSTKKKEVLSEVTFTSPISAIWKKDGTSVIIKESGSDGPSFHLVSLTPPKDPIPLKRGIQYLLWDELEDKVLYIYKDSAGNNSLNRSLPDGSEWKEISKLPSTPIFIRLIPKSPLIGIWEKPTNTRLGELKTISISSGETKTLFSGKYGANYLWSPDGEKILMSWSPEKNTSRLTLSLLNKIGGNYTDLKFPTIVEKCIWLRDNITIYCSLPGSFGSTSVMPDDFYSPSSITYDTFWKINTETGQSDRLVTLENMSNSFDAVNFLVSPDESELFFMNQKDLKLYSIEL